MQQKHKELKHFGFAWCVFVKVLYYVTLCYVTLHVAKIKLHKGESRHRLYV